MRGRNRQVPSQEGEGLENRPFRSLRTLIKDAGEKPAPPRVVSPPANRERSDNGAASGGESDTDLFLRQIDGVRPLGERQRQRVAAPPPAQPGRPVITEEAEALAELADLVTGKAPFDISDSDEYIEGAVKGIDPRVVRRLRRGELAHQAHLDLHGMTADEARPAVDRFLLESHRAGHRCVLIIHGRGLNSRDQIPVLKNRVTSWLARGQWSRLVLAFTSARPYDGGAGALYVLLRRERASKREIQVHRSN